MNPLITVLRIYFGSFIGLENSRKKVFVVTFDIIQKCTAICHDGIFLLSSTDELNFCLRPSAKQRRNTCSEPLLVYQDLITRDDWPVEKQLSICQSD